MAARTILDTNVLVYAHVRSEPEKQRQALESWSESRAQALVR